MSLEGVLFQQKNQLNEWKLNIPNLQEFYGIFIIINMRSSFSVFVRAEQYEIWHLF